MIQLNFFKSANVRCCRSEDSAPLSCHQIFENVVKELRKSFSENTEKKLVSRKILLTVITMINSWIVGKMENKVES